MLISLKYEDLACNPCSCSSVKIIVEIAGILVGVVNPCKLGVVWSANLTLGQGMRQMHLLAMC